MKSCPQKTAFSTHWEVYAEIMSVKFMNEMGQVELLAPAGSFQALKGALHAGADAVYLGGEKFGARAYADNFIMEEIIQGIHFAHVFGRKIYLTVNTLVKDKELDSLYDFCCLFMNRGWTVSLSRILERFGSSGHIFRGCCYMQAPKWRLLAAMGRSCFKKKVFQELCRHGNSL